MKIPFRKLISGIILAFFTCSSLKAQVNAGFNINYPNPVCSPAIISFSNTTTASNPPITYQWNFGVNPGVNSTQNNPSASYANCGTFNVQLIATNALGIKDTIVQQVTINCNPSVSFIVTPTAGCVPLNVQFTNTSTAGSGVITGYTWDLGDGNTSSAVSPAHTYTNPGCKNVTLTVTNSFGCSASATVTGAVCPTNQPSANFTANPLVSCAPPAAVTYTFTGGGGAVPYSYAWSFPGGSPASSALQNPVVTYNAAGNYTSTLLMTDANGCTSTITKTNYVSVYNYTTDINLSALAGCAPFTVVCQATASAGGATYSWTTNPNGNPATSTAISPSFTFNSPGSYQICLTSTFPNGCVASKCTTVNVVASPAAFFNVSGNGQTCNPPLNVNYSNASSGSGIIQYQWTFNGGNPATYNGANPPTIAYSNCGSFGTTLIVTNNTGCADTFTLNNIVNVDCPIACFTVTPGGGCQGSSFSFDPSCSGGSPTQFLWNFGDGATSTAANPTHTYALLGCYDVTLTITNALGCTNTITMNDIVCTGVAPNANFSANPLVACAGDIISFTNQTTGTTSYTTYQWDFDGYNFEIQSTLVNPNHGYSDTGYMNVTLVACNYGCCDTLELDSLLYIDPPVGLFNIFESCSNPYEVTLDGTPSLGADTYSWNIPGGIPSTSADSIVLVTYPITGTYSITLTVTNNNSGCSFERVKTVDINDVEADFTATPTSGCSPLYVCLNNLSVQATSFSWRITDSLGNVVFNSGAANPCATLTMPGDYTVRLISTDQNNCKDTLIKTDYIRVYGTWVDYAAFPVNGCAPFTVPFTDQSTGLFSFPVAWQWDFGDPVSGFLNTSSLQDPTHTYTENGGYDVTLIVTDNVGCMDTLVNNQYIYAIKPTAAFDLVDSTSCLGEQSCFFNTSSGSQPISFSWQFGDGNTSALISPCHTYTAANLYDVTLIATDAGGCLDTTVRQQLVGKPSADFIADTTTTTCPPLNVQFSNLSTGLDSNATYLWDFGDGQSSILSDPFHVYNQAGQFDVTLIVTDVNGCMDTIILANYINISGPVGTAVSLPSVGCAPLDITAIVNSNAILFSWDFGDGTVINTTNDSITYTYTNGGTYYLQVILNDGLGCTVALPVDTIVTNNPIVTFTTFPPVFCQSGNVVFDDSVATAFPITSEVWDFGDPNSGANNTSTINNPLHYYDTAGIYIVSLTVSNQYGCSDVFYDTVEVSPPPIPAFTIDDSTICPSTSVTVTDVSYSSSGVFMESWNFGDPGSGMQNFASGPLATHTYSTPGTYTIWLTVMAMNGCSAATSHTVTVFNFAQATAGADQTVCLNDSAQLNASGGVSYAWNNASTLSNPSISNPEAFPTLTTNYVVTVTDVNGCLDTDTALVSILALPNIIASNDTSICTFSSVGLSANGGVSYNWNPSMTLSNPFIANPVATPPATTTYYVTGTDANNCSNIDSVTVSLLPLPIADAGMDILVCDGNTTQLIATGGIIYLWSPSTGLSNANIPDPLCTPAASTTYTVTVTDSNSCSASDAVQVDIAPLPPANAGPDVAYCPGGSTQLNASGGISYDWSPSINLSDTSINNPIANPGSTTTYTVTVLSGNGCIATDSMTVMVNSLPVIDAGNNANVCEGTSTILNGSGAISYQWTPTTGLSNPAISNPTATPITTTTYFVTGTDLNGCMNSDSVTITVLTLPLADAGADVNICTGDSTQLQATGGVTYSWSPASGLSNANISNPVAYPSGTTTFTLTITGTNGCDATDDVVINILALPVANAGPDAAICDGGSTQLNASGGISYTWSPINNLSDPNINNPVANPIANNVYTVIVMGINGCIALDSLLITVNALPAVDAGADVSLCSGSQTILLASGATNYTWSPATGLNNINISNPIASPAASLLYYVTGIDANGCANYDSVYVTVNSLPVADAGPDQLICAGDSAQLVASGGATYSWSPAAGLNDSFISNPIASPTATTVYTVVATDGNSCSASDLIIVSVNPLPVVNAGNDTIVCSGLPMQLLATGAINYSWSPATFLSDPNIANPVALLFADQTYTVQGINANGCIGFDTLLITVMQPFIATYSPDTFMCEGGSVQLEALGSSNYNWSPASGLSDADISNPMASPTTTTLYTVTVSDGVCFSQAGTVLIIVHPTPLVDAGADQTILAGEEVQLNSTVTDNTNGTGNYLWSPGEGLNCTTCEDPMALPERTTTYTVDYSNIYGCRETDSLTIFILCNGDVIYVPNAFTPNGDGRNDVFRVRSNGLSEITFLRVYDRWGGIVFETTDVNNGWDGTSKGMKLAPGVFIYYLEAVCSNDGTVFKKGNVTLLK